MTLNLKVQGLRRELNGLVIESAELVDGIILALLTRENILALSPPGRAKSYAIRLVRQAVTGSTYFERLLTAQAKPDLIFGPIKVSELKQDRIRHPDKGFLQHAHLAFVDEVFKSNAALLHGLLNAMNEHVFEDGDIVRDIPLEVLLAASNELPKEEGLEAVYDRFLLRYRLDYIQEDGNFLAMLRTPDKPVLQNHVTLDELHAAQGEVALVQVPDSIMEAIIGIRKALLAEAIQASDRRWKKSVRVIQAHAWLNGRGAAAEDDLVVLADILWTAPEHRDAVSRVVIQTANPAQREVDVLMDQVYSAYRELERSESKSKANQGIEVVVKINEAVGKMQVLIAKMRAEGRDATRAEGQVARASEIRDVRIGQGILKFPPDMLRKLAEGATKPAKPAK